MNTVLSMIAEHESVSLELNCNYFNELSYIVQDVLKDVFAVFEFSRWNELERATAYEKAAKLYNTLVPDTECIPMF